MNNAQMVEEFLQSPFQTFCGLNVIDTRDGQCTADLIVQKNVLNMSGMLHGGVVYSMLDVVSFVAAMTKMEEGEYPVTHHLTSAIYQAVPEGNTLHFEANIRKRGKRIVVTHCEIFDITDGSRKLVAEGSVTKSILNANRITHLPNHKGD